MLAIGPVALLQSSPQIVLHMLVFFVSDLLRHPRQPQLAVQQISVPSCLEIIKHLRVFRCDPCHDRIVIHVTGSWHGRDDESLNRRRCRRLIGILASAIQGDGRAWRDAICDQHHD